MSRLFLKNPKRFEVVETIYGIRTVGVGNPATPED